MDTLNCGILCWPWATGIKLRSNLYVSVRFCGVGLGWEGLRCDRVTAPASRHNAPLGGARMGRVPSSNQRHHWKLKLRGTLLHREAP